MLMRLTDRALAEHGDIQLVVWSETAVVPDIVRHYRSAADAERHALVRSLLEYIESKDCAFVIGNNHAEASGAFNSALYFEPKKNVLPPHPQVYSKMRLVPLTEFLPKSISLLAPLFRSLDAHFWSAGERVTVFDCDGVAFATPICFEDTFPSLVRTMRKNGAELVVNLSNDSWSHSRACQKQHLAMAAFRSAENRMPSVRSTASGETAVIDRFGSVVASAPAFEPCYLYARVFVPTGKKRINKVE